MGNKKLSVFTDGSYQPSVNDKVSGWGYIVLSESDPIKEDSGIVLNPSSRQVDGEIEAVCKSIDFLFKYLQEKNELDTEIVIHHDYNGLGHWARDEWKRNKPLTRAYKGFIDQHVILGMNLTFEWTRGHDGNYWNEYVDGLATSAVKNWEV